MSTFLFSGYSAHQYVADKALLVGLLSGCELIPIECSSYRFCLNAVTEQVPPLSSSQCQALARLIHCAGIYHSILDTVAPGEGSYLLLSEEDRGAVLATAVLLQLGGSLALARWMLPVEREEIPVVALSMEYTTQKLYLMGLRKDEPGRDIIIIDDFVSTGGTLLALIEGVQQQTSHRVKGIITLADKGYGGIERVEREAGIQVVTLAELDLSGETSKVSRVCLP